MAPLEEVTVESVAARRRSRASSPPPLAPAADDEKPVDPAAKPEPAEATSARDAAGLARELGSPRARRLSRVSVSEPEASPNSSLRGFLATALSIAVLALAVWAMLPSPVAATLRRAWDWAPLSLIFAFGLPTSSPSASEDASGVLLAARRTLCFMAGIALMAAGAWARGSPPLLTAGAAAAVVLWKKFYGEEHSNRTGQTHNP